MAVTEASIAGSLLGTAVGDALGLPFEGLSRRRAARLFGPPDRFRLLPNRGMVSDDTEHACMTAQALIAAGNDERLFARALARHLRLWLLAAPAGIGLATLRSTLKLCVGVSPESSGVYSAGNGPAMRAPILGVAIDDLELLKKMLRSSTRITHTDPRAEQGAFAVALAARWASERRSIDAGDFVAELRRAIGREFNEELARLIDAVAISVERGESTRDFADAQGWTRGVSGYINHTVPAVLHVWLRHPHDYPSAVREIITCGGDTDTTAAIVGGIVGAAVGPEGIPSEWIDGIWEWPRSVAWLNRLAATLAESRRFQVPRPAPRLPYLAVLPRNALFAAVVMTHGFRRLLPPY